MPYLHNLEHLTIGISYSLEDKDVFAALAKLEKLRTIKVRWYLQLNSPPPSVFIEEWPLITLEVLEVGYSSRALRAMVPADFDPNHTHYWEPISHSLGNESCPLCAWVTKVTAGSPKLRDVVFANEDDDDEEEEDSVGDYEEYEDESVDEDEVNRVMQIMSMMRDMSMREVGLGLEERIIEEEDN